MSISSSRAVSSVIATILMVAIVVILAATVSVFTLGIADDINRPGPLVAQSSGELVSGGTNQIVRLTHIAGDSLTVSNLEIVVDAQDACGGKSRIVNLPTNTLGPENYNGDDIFDYFSPDGGQLDTSADGTWEPGETASFRLASGECELNSDDKITVRVIHTPTRSVVIQESLITT